jgi:large subunit ribosomal protein L3
MVEGLIGKKLGITQVFDEDGMIVPVTVIQAGPCIVVQKKTKEKDGYEKVQLGFVDPSRKVRANKPMAGHLKRAKAPAVRVLREFTFTEEGEEESQVKVGDQILVKDVFEVRDLVSVTGKAKGRGFQGVIKRHGFSGGRATHGSMFHRAPGSIGASATPSRVVPGMKLPGQMGNDRVTVRRLEVVQIDEENNLLLVKGSVPGARGGYVRVTRTS